MVKQKFFAVQENATYPATQFRYMGFICFLPDLAY